MDFGARTIRGSFAREIEGLELWQPLAADTVERLRLEWKQAGVLLFRRQSLTEDELADFSAQFGVLEAHPRSDWNSTSNPNIVQLSNLRNFSGQEIGGLGVGEIDWHSDQSYKTRPGTGAVLYGVEVPKDGAATYFANLRLAYQALHDDLKRRIDSLDAIYDYGRRAASYSGQQPDAATIRRRFPLVTHKLVYADPITGAKSLYMDPLTMNGIVGMRDPDARTLLDELAAHATGDKFVYRHEWQAGDVLMWDNATMLHRRDPVGGRPRLLKRTTIALPAQCHVIPEGALLENAT
jgi:alpha-ketoglutarate-dependent taurine dioxygenase